MREFTFDLSRSDAHTRRRLVSLFAAAEERLGDRLNAYGRAYAHAWLCVWCERGESGIVAGWVESAFSEVIAGAVRISEPSRDGSVGRRRGDTP